MSCEICGKVGYLWNVLIKKPTTDTDASADADVQICDHCLKWERNWIMNRLVEQVEQ